MDIKLDVSKSNVQELFGYSEKESDMLADRLQELSEKRSKNVFELVQKGIEVAKNEKELAYLMLGIGGYIQTKRTINF